MPVTIRPYDAARESEALRALAVERQDFSRTLEPSWPPGKTVVDDYVAFLERECAAHGGCVFMAEEASPPHSWLRQNRSRGPAAHVSYASV